MALEISQVPSSDDVLGEKNFYSRAWREIFLKANEKSASDIHAESLRSGLVIRLRIHGELIVDQIISDRHDAVSLVDKLKEIAKLDLTDKSRLQDGSFRLATWKCTYRISLSPGYEYGECAVLRIIKEDEVPCLENLRLQPNVIADVQAALAHKQGLILVTGPTGSGKSTTLQACIGALDRSSKKVISIEDPPERITSGVIHERITQYFNWTSAIKGAMRQDPDVILVGEIRDLESAKLAVEAAQTGHLVLSTLHANNVPSTVTRLLTLGVEKHLIADAFVLISAQRLLKTLCNFCKLFEGELCIRNPVGCNECHGTGYSGRIPILEYCLTPDPELIFNFDQKLFTQTLRQSLEGETRRLIREQIIDHRLVSLQNTSSTMANVINFRPRMR